MMFTCIEWAHLFWQSLPRTMKCVCPWRVANSENVGRATGTYTCIYIYTDLLYIVCGHYLRVDDTLLKSFVTIVQ